MTLSDVETSIQNLLLEQILLNNKPLVDDAINDGIESLWESLIITSLETLLGGPVANLSFASASTRQQIASVADPTVAPVLGQVVAGALPGGTNYFLAYTVVTESGTETNLSPVSQIVRTVNNQITMQPPALGVLGQGQGIGYNVYGGTSAANLALQNTDPMDYATVWNEVINGSAAGIVPQPDNPPPPTKNTTADDVFYIDHMEIQTPDGTWKSWNQSEVNSEMMRRAARTLADASLYQNYYFDLISGGQLELRPAAGAALNPQYFYVQKPRRLRFPNSPIPFFNTPCVAFIKYFAISLIKLAFEEYTASNLWGQKAETERMNAMKAMTKQNTNKNNSTITPFLIS